MENFPAYYTMLFNAITEALRLIGESRYADAALLLKDAQIRAEGTSFSYPGTPFHPGAPPWETIPRSAPIQPPQGGARPRPAVFLQRF